MVMSSSNMNAAVHTSTSVHRCRDDISGTSAIGLTTPSGGRSRQMQRSCQNCKWNVSSTWGWVAVDTSRTARSRAARRHGADPLPGAEGNVRLWRGHEVFSRSRFVGRG